MKTRYILKKNHRDKRRLSNEEPWEDYKGRYYVYALSDSFGVIYIGSSQSLDARIAAHKKDKKFNWVSVIECASGEDMLSLERKMIRKYQPLLNEQMNDRSNYHQVWHRPALKGKIKNSVKEIIEDENI